MHAIVQTDVEIHNMINMEAFLYQLQVLYPHPPASDMCLKAAQKFYNVWQSMYKDCRWQEQERTGGGEKGQEGEVCGCINMVCDSR